VNLLSPAPSLLLPLSDSFSPDFVASLRLEALLSQSAIGLHTMWNEHFGISIVEMLAAGLLVIAHNSGGPALDIVNPQEGKDQTGYLAASEEEYSQSMRVAVDLLEENERCREVRARGRQSTQRFSDEKFISSLTDHLETFIPQIMHSKVPSTSRGDHR
jgi:alpha-1,2-mannosyltransferase